MYKGEGMGEEEENSPLPLYTPATQATRLATLLRRVGCCWLKFENGQQHPTCHKSQVLLLRMLLDIALQCCDPLAGGLDYLLKLT